MVAAPHEIFQITNFRIFVPGYSCMGSLPVLMQRELKLRGRGPPSSSSSASPRTAVHTPYVQPYTTVRTSVHTPHVRPYLVINIWLVMFEKGRASGGHDTVSRSSVYSWAMQFVRFSSKLRQDHWIFDSRIVCAAQPCTCNQSRSYGRVDKSLLRGHVRGGIRGMYTNEHGKILE